MSDTSSITDEQWKKQLTPEQYYVLRKADTETPFSGACWNSYEPGVYRCAGCGNVLFSSEEKFDSGTGWPSFWKSMDGRSVTERKDVSHDMERIEVVCSHCGGHLGHVFPDGPKPTGLRYCINSAVLKFDDKK